MLKGHIKLKSFTATGFNLWFSIDQRTIQRHVEEKKMGRNRKIEIKKNRKCIKWIEKYWNYKRKKDWMRENSHRMKAYQKEKWILRQTGRERNIKVQVNYGHKDRSEQMYLSSFLPYFSEQHFVHWYLTINTIWIIFLSFPIIFLPSLRNKRWQACVDRTTEPIQWNQLTN